MTKKKTKQILFFPPMEDVWKHTGIIKSSIVESYT